ncbi:MAG TPA: sigma-70 region 4 domain-containing protein, partial [Saprospiraceae bacterium]|nr:sigma-70 region 4 domain-containing protein [Saprospiraceae bacterium]
ALDQLPQGYRQVITMYVLENKSHKEIAQALNITESSSRSQLTRAKIYLKKLINKSEYGRI